MLVGRGPELALLEERAGKAAEGEGRAVLITGDAGIGKTRLVAELITHWRAGGRARAGFAEHDRQGGAPPAGQGGQVLTGVCAEGELTLPFLPFVEAIGNHLAVPDPGRGQLGSYRHELARLLPSLAEAPPVDPSDPATGRRRLFDALIESGTLGSGQAGDSIEGRAAAAVGGRCRRIRAGGAAGGETGLDFRPRCEPGPSTSTATTC